MIHLHELLSRIQYNQKFGIIMDRPRFLNHAAEIEDKLLHLMMRLEALERR